MRMFLAALLAAAFTALPGPAQITPQAQAQAQDCTGDNCPKPADQGGRDCESKKDNTIS